MRLAGTNQVTGRRNCSLAEMTALSQEEIIKFLKDNIQPLPDRGYGDGYRAAVTLTDKLYLPCVMFRNSSKITNLAIKRFKQERKGKNFLSKSTGFGYKEVVKIFVANGNCINHYNIAKVEPSNFAFPENILEQIEGETKMGWTGFVARMKDGKQFAFGTSFHFEFFDMPSGYSTADIIEIINHSYLDKDGNLKRYHSRELSHEFDRSMVYREKPYFDCYIDHL